jgi:hypothetical protein
MAEVPRESPVPSIVRQGNLEDAKVASQVQRVKQKYCSFIKSSTSLLINSIYFISEKKQAVIENNLFKTGYVHGGLKFHNSHSMAILQDFLLNCCRDWNLE